MSEFELLDARATAQPALDFGPAGRFEPKLRCLREHFVSLGARAALAGSSKFRTGGNEPLALLFNHCGQIRQINDLVILLDPALPHKLFCSAYHDHRTGSREEGGLPPNAVRSATLKNSPQ